MTEGVVIPQETGRIKKPAPARCGSWLCFSIESIGGVGHQGHGAGALDRHGQLALVLGAGAGHAAGQNLAALAGEPAKPSDILVIDVLNLIYAESTDLPARLAAAGTPSSKTSKAIKARTSNN